MEAALCDLAPGATTMQLHPRPPPRARGLLRYAPRAPPALGQDDREGSLHLQSGRGGSHRRGDGQGVKFHGILVLAGGDRVSGAEAAAAGGSAIAAAASKRAEPSLAVTALVRG